MKTLATRRTGDGYGGLQRRMDDMFSRFLGDWFGEEPTEMGTYWPAVDVSETDENLVVKAELPGARSEDIDISVQGNTLTIRGEKKTELEGNEGRYRHVERRYGSFQRTFTLPSEVDAEKIEATHRDGVLTITLPKRETAKPHRIPVK